MASLAASTTPPTTVVGERIIMDQKIQQDPQQKMQQQLQPPIESLRCPRCESTNTKFCYYNNYSLSQPRHFCKACKRYWTKGGTLRNVPVGGGCRKNKRVKRPSINSNSNNNSSSSSNTNTNTNTVEGSVNSASSSVAGTSLHELVSSGSNHILHTPMFYGSDFNFPFSRYDFQNPPQIINGLGLGFSSGLIHNMNSMNIHNNNQKIVQDLISSNPLLSSYATTTSAATATTTTTTTPPTISSILASSLHQMKGSSNNNNNNNFETILPSYEVDLQMKGSGMHVKEVKMEFQGQNRSFDNNHHWDTTNTTQNQMDHHHQPMGSNPDPSILWGSNNGPNLGAWLDPSNNLGSSVPSLI